MKEAKQLQNRNIASIVALEGKIEALSVELSEKAELVSGKEKEIALASGVEQRVRDELTESRQQIDHFHGEIQALQNEITGLESLKETIIEQLESKTKLSDELQLKLEDTLNTGMKAR